MVENLLWLARLFFLGLVYWFFFKLIRAVTMDFGSAVVKHRPEPDYEGTDGRRSQPVRNQPVRHAQSAGPAEPMPVQPAPVLYLREKPAQAAIYGRLSDSGQERIIEAGQPVPLGESMSVGRNPDNQLVITEPFVSGRHARFYRQNDGYWVEDLGSTNGTFLNGRRLKKPRPLRNGDKVRFGDTVFEFVR